MLQRRRLLLMVLGFAGLAVLGAGLITWLAGPKHRITLESAETIRPGMSLEEVEQILGPASAVPPAWHGEATRRVWTTDPYVGWFAELAFDEQGRVTNVMLVETTGTKAMPDGVLDKVRRWLGL